MNWLLHLHDTSPVAHAIWILSLVCVVGMAFGSVQVRGIRLGTAGVLFAGILAGAVGNPIDHATLEFVKEFGLILFVFTIGLQLGPGFFSALQRQGVRLNVIAAAVVVLGGVLAVGIGVVLQMDFAGVIGMLAGATTNTPSLGAAQQTLSTLPGVSQERVTLPALAYAVSYPAAIAGIIGTLLALKTILRIDPDKEVEAFTAAERGSVEPLERRTLIVENANLAGVTIDAIPSREETQVTISRLRRAGDAAVLVARGNTPLRVGDEILAVGTGSMLERFQRVVGCRSREDLAQAPGNVTFRRVVVTHKDVLGKSVAELALDTRYGVVLVRALRAGAELTGVPGLRLQFGDTVHIVGNEESLDRVEALLGNSVKRLDETHFVPLFLGIAMGIALGTLPIAVPGIPQPVLLGLAGGPLIVALVIGRFGRIGKLVSHMPLTANLSFREFGVSLFFAAVGLAAGPQFFGSVFSANGLLWLIAGLLVTIVPLFLGGLLMRSVLKMNFVVISGLLAGSVTDPPALAFANHLFGSDSPTVAYAAVYPFTMLLRILTAQILTLTLVQ